MLLNLWFRLFFTDAQDKEIGRFLYDFFVRKVSI